MDVCLPADYLACRASEDWCDAYYAADDPSQWLGAEALVSPEAVVFANKESRFAPGKAKRRLTQIAADPSWHVC
jgi:hypothetical protein